MWGDSCNGMMEILERWGRGGKNEDFKFKCPDCGSKIIADIESGGQNITCPSCEKSQTIPLRENDFLRAFCFVIFKMTIKSWRSYS